MEKIRGKISARNCFTVDSLGKRGGGLALLWFEGVDLEVVNFFESHIHTKIKDNSNGEVSYFTCFYSAPKTSKRAMLWNLLGKINPDMDNSWCVMGDFNKITT